MEHIYKTIGGVRPSITTANETTVARHIYRALVECNFYLP
jgi:hypothetical protein